MQDFIEYFQTRFPKLIGQFQIQSFYRNFPLPCGRLPILNPTTVDPEIRAANEREAPVIQ